MIDICICTHNPRQPLFAAVLEAIADQDAPEDTFRVTIVDNASNPPVPEAMLAPLQARGVATRIVREPRLGLVAARLHAIDATDSEWLLFVDDDNVIAPDFISEGRRFIAAHPEVGCFGGRLILPRHIVVPPGREPFLPFLGIRDLGGATRIGRSSVWVEYEPPGAGAFVKRAVLNRFNELTHARPEAFALGRSGGGLASCDDSLLMRCAVDVGLAMAYDPALKLDHHIAPERFDRTYLRRLMRAYGESQVTLQRAHTGTAVIPRYYANAPMFAAMIVLGFLKNSLRSVDFAIAQAEYHFAARKAFQAPR